MLPLAQPAVHINYVQDHSLFPCSRVNYSRVLQQHSPFLSHSHLTRAPLRLPGGKLTPCLPSLLPNLATLSLSSSHPPLLELPVRLVGSLLLVCLVCPPILHHIPLKLNHNLPQSLSTYFSSENPSVGVPVSGFYSNFVKHSTLVSIVRYLPYLLEYLPLHEIIVSLIFHTF